MKSAIGQRHYGAYANGLQPKRKPASFNTEYNRMLRASLGRSGHVAPVMRKSVPPYLAKVLAEASRSQNEWGGGVDFELLQNEPERMLMVRGRDDQVQRDADMELPFHTHPPPWDGMTGFTVNIFPSPTDVTNTKFGKPELIAARDNDGRTRYVLVRSTRPIQQKHYKKQLQDTFDAIIAMYKYPFETREDRARFGREYRKACNELGYDFMHVKLDQHVLEVLRDDKPEYAVQFRRKATSERKIVASFNQAGFDPGVHAAFRDGRLHLIWTGPPGMVDPEKLAAWMARNNLSVRGHDINKYPYNKHHTQHYELHYDPGERTANEPGGKSHRESRRPRWPARRGRGVK